jgi:hypothetical protein
VIFYRGGVTAAPAPSTAQSWTCGWGTFSATNLPGACWRPFSDQSFMNTPLPANPRLVSNSDAMIARIMTFGPLRPLTVDAAPGMDYFHPYFFSRSTDPVYTVNSSRGDDPVTIHIPRAAQPAGAEDSHLAVYDQDAGYEYAFFQFPKSRPANGGTITAGLVQKAKISGNGGGDDEIQGYSTGASTGLMGGIIRFPEVATGRIEHAIFLVSGKSNGKQVYPARNYGNPCGVPDCPPEGQWIMLDMSAAEIDALPVAAWQKTIFHALAKYGGWVGDQGGNEALSLQVEGPSTWTSYGLENPWEPWAAQQRTMPGSRIDTYEDGSGRTHYLLDTFDAPIDWKARLKAVDPCVIKHTC